MSDTPETVEAVRAALLEGNYTVPLIMVDACKKLERERDELRRQLRDISATLLDGRDPVDVRMAVRKLRSFQSNA